jgi:hypothetical protein
LRHWLLLNIGVYIGWALIRIWGLTLRVKWEGREHWESCWEKPVIMAFTHSDMTGMALGFHRWGWRRLSKQTTMLTSPSRDGNLNARYLQLLGAETVLGSSAKRRTTALRGLADALERGRRVGIAVDGPRGPRMVAKGGAAALSKQLNVPVLVLAIRPSRALTFGDWARTQLPLPFTTLHARFAEPRVLSDVEAGTTWITESLGRLKN